MEQTQNKREPIRIGVREKKFEKKGYLNICNYIGKNTTIIEVWKDPLVKNSYVLLGYNGEKEKLIADSNTIGIFRLKLKPEYGYLKLNF